MLDFGEQEFSFDREVEKTNFEHVWNRLSARCSEFIEKEDLIKLNHFDAEGDFLCYVCNVSIDTVFKHIVAWEEFGDLIVLMKEFIYRAFDHIMKDDHKGLNSIVIEMPQLYIDCINEKYSRDEFLNTKKSFLDFLEWIRVFEKKNKFNITFKQCHSFIQVKWNQDHISHQEFLANNTEQLIATSSKYNLTEIIGYTEIKAFRKIIEYSFNKVEKYGIRI